MRKAVFALLFCSGYCFADVGDVWPTQEEIDKAPETPAALEVDVRDCTAPDAGKFLEMMRSKGFVGDDAYRISDDGFADLNQDGICEILASQRMYCGMGGCSNPAFQLDGDAFRFIGIGPSGTHIAFYAPHNGYLQCRHASYSGTSYAYHYYRFEDGQYRRWRSDRFEERWLPDTEERKTFYDHTEYFDH